MGAGGNGVADAGAAGGGSEGEAALTTIIIINPGSADLKRGQSLVILVLLATATFSVVPSHQEDKTTS
jgi:hypothetical protein